MKLFISLCFILFFCINTAFSCSVVFLSKKDYKIVGRTHDWKKRKGLVKFHKSGILKSAQLWGDYIPKDVVPVKWTSKNNSIVFIAEEHNDYYMPIDGINDKGLVICELYVEHQKNFDLAFSNEKDVLMGADWVEYVLDNYSSVDDVMRNLFNLRLINTFKCHWFLCDASGNNAVVEYVNGNLRIYYGQPLTIPVLTNTVYSVSCETLVNYKIFGGKNEMIDKKYSSLSRFVKAYDFLKEYKQDNNPALFIGKEVLTKIAQPIDKTSATQWLTVYDLNYKVIYYRKAFDPTTYQINMSDILSKPDDYIIDKIFIKPNNGKDTITKEYPLNNKSNLDPTIKT